MWFMCDFACCNWQKNHSDYKIEKLLYRTGNQSTHDHIKLGWLCKSAQLPCFYAFSLKGEVCNFWSTSVTKWNYKNNDPTISTIPVCDRSVQLIPVTHSTGWEKEPQNQCLNFWGINLVTVCFTCKLFLRSKLKNHQP